MTTPHVRKGKTALLVEHFQGLRGRIRWEQKKKKGGEGLASNEIATPYRGAAQEGVLAKSEIAGVIRKSVCLLSHIAVKGKERTRGGRLKLGRVETSPTKNFPKKILAQKKTSGGKRKKGSSGCSGSLPF